MIAKTEKEIEILREAGKILGSILIQTAEIVRPGIATKELDEFAERLILKSGGRPSFKGYKNKPGEKPFPGSVCVSINEEVVHGIPSSARILQEGALLSLDIGLEYRGFYVDAAITVPVGKIDESAQKILEVGKEALEIGVAAAKSGGFTGDIGAAIQKFVERRGFNVIRQLVGHGVGAGVHEEPEVPNFGEIGKGRRLEKGMVLALEPMISEGQPEVVLNQNGWTWKTKDNSRAVHFEETIIVRDGGGEVLTS